MAGLFGFFGKKKDDTKAEQAKLTETNGSKPQAYFLDADQAKTFGNIDYMRTAKTVKRTFPKTMGNGGTFERVQTVSTLEAAKAAALQSAMVQAEIDATASSKSSGNQSESKATERRRADSSMDQFRNMARDIRKNKL